MTRQGWTDWADKKVHTEQCRGNETVYDCEARLLRNEHRRAVRVVKREIEAVKNDQRTYHSEEKCLILGSLETVLKALQRGRE